MSEPMRPEQPVDEQPVSWLVHCRAGGCHALWRDGSEEYFPEGQEIKKGRGRAVRTEGP